MVAMLALFWTGICQSLSMNGLNHCYKLRNGLRPARYCLTADDHLYLMSEVGVNDFDVEDVIRKVGHIAFALGWRKDK